MDLWAPSSLIEVAVAFLQAVHFERACTCWLVMTMLPASAAAGYWSAHLVAKFQLLPSFAFSTPHLCVARDRNVVEGIKPP